MRTASLVASTVMLLSAPAAPVATHAVSAAPVAPRVQLPPRKPAVETTPIAPTPTCQVTPEPGWVVWYPGQVAPYILYASTDGHVYYEAPAGHIVAVHRTVNPDGSISQIEVIGALPTSCGWPLPPR